MTILPTAWKNGSSWWAIIEAHAPLDPQTNHHQLQRQQKQNGDTARDPDGLVVDHVRHEVPHGASQAWQQEACFRERETGGKGRGGGEGERARGIALGLFLRYTSIDKSDKDGHHPTIFNL